MVMAAMRSCRFAAANVSSQHERVMNSLSKVKLRLISLKAACFEENPFSFETIEYIASQNRQWRKS